MNGSDEDVSVDVDVREFSLTPKGLREVDAAARRVELNSTGCRRMI